MEIATANPLLNLAAALGQANPGLSTNAPGTFAVKRRWDDGKSMRYLPPHGAPLLILMRVCT